MLVWEPLAVDGRRQCEGDRQRASPKQQIEWLRGEVDDHDGRGCNSGSRQLSSFGGGTLVIFCEDDGEAQRVLPKRHGNNRHETGAVQVSCILDSDNLCSSFVL